MKNLAEFLIVFIPGLLTILAGLGNLVTGKNWTVNWYLSGKFPLINRFWGILYILVGIGLVYFSFLLFKSGA